MTNFRMALLDLLRKDQGPFRSFFGTDSGSGPGADGRRGHRAIGAAPYERTDKRVTSRNGVREREWDTRVGTIELAIPKLRQRSYFPSLLEPRRRHERALRRWCKQAYVQGVSTRNVDALAQRRREMAAA